MTQMERWVGGSRRGAVFATRSIRTVGIGLIAAAQLAGIGCTTARSRVGPAAPTACGTSACAAPATRTASQPSRPPRRPNPISPASRSNLGRFGPIDSGYRSNGSLERAVARFTASPVHIFDPAAQTRPWRYIVIHHSGETNGGFQSIDRYHRDVNGWDECGYHFVVGNGTESGDGEIEVGGRWATQKHGAHAKQEDGNQEYNDFGIGVCLIGNFNDAPPTARQIEASRRLVAYLQERFGVPANRVIGHGAVKHTDCPGRHFPMDQIISQRGYADRRP